MLLIKLEVCLLSLYKSLMFLQLGTSTMKIRKMNQNSNQFYANLNKNTSRILDLPATVHLVLRFGLLSRGAA